MTTNSQQENVAPQDSICVQPADGALQKLFASGQAIATHRADNLFQTLEQRSLTEEEQKIIEQRVALQRKMFEEYELREKRRKVVELQEVVPDLTEAEAEVALQLCDGREDDAAAQLVSEPSFRDRVRAGPAVSSPATATDEPTAATAGRAVRRERSGGPRRHAARPAGPRPKVIDPSSLADSVFVGAFRGKGFKPPPKARGTVRRGAIAVSGVPGHASEHEQEVEISEEDEKQQQAAASERTGRRKRPQRRAARGSRQAARSSDSEQTDEEDEGENEEEEQEAGEHTEEDGRELQAGFAAVGTDAAASGQPPGSVAKEHVLVVQTSQGLRPVTDSELKRLQQPSLAPSRGGPALPAGDAAPGQDAAAGPVVVPAMGMLKTMCEKLVTLHDAAAGSWLRRMAPAVRAAVLEQLGSSDPDRAAACFALLEGGDSDGDAQQQAPTLRAQAGESRQQRGASGSRIKGEHCEQDEGQDEQLTRRPRRAAVSAARKLAASAQQPASGSEATEDEASAASSDDDFQQPRPGRARTTRQAATAVAQRLAKAAAASALTGSEEGEGSGEEEEDEEATESDEELHNGSRVARRPPAKRQRTASSEHAGGEAATVQPVPAATVRRAGSTGAEAAEGPRPPGRVVLNAALAARQPRVRAISSTGHTCRGRVRQKSHKSAELVDAGKLRAAKGWCNAGYIFPEGFHSRTLFRSSVAIDQLCVHECYILGREGQFWPGPTFKVVALDRPDEPLIAKSCTGCWTGILKRINAEIEAQRRAGQDLPPPPKTAIAGPEYFGLNQPNVSAAVEALDPDHLCTEYWTGKAERQRAAAGLPAGTAQRPRRAPRASGGSGDSRRAGGGGRGRKRRSDASETDEEDECPGEGEEDETQYMTSKWSAVNRTERYRKRLQDCGEDASGVDEDNPLPDFIDPITLEAVVRPAISPYGHVMGLATWRAVLGDHQACPFTKQLLKVEELKVLTKSNIHLHRDRIIR